MKIKKLNESSELNDSLIEDIDSLIDRLDYLKNFIKSKFKEDDLNFHKKMSTISVDIKLLSQKLTYKK